MRTGPDVLEEFKTEFGMLGPALHQAVIKARHPSTQSSSGSLTLNQSSIIQPGNLCIFIIILLKIRSFILFGLAKSIIIDSLGIVASRVY